MIYYRSRMTNSPTDHHLISNSSLCSTCTSHCPLPAYPLIPAVEPPPSLSASAVYSSPHSRSCLWDRKRSYVHSRHSRRTFLAGLWRNLPWGRVRPRGSRCSRRCRHSLLLLHLPYVASVRMTLLCVYCGNYWIFGIVENRGKRFAAGMCARHSMLVPIHKACTARPAKNRCFQT